MCFMQVHANGAFRLLFVLFFLAPWTLQSLAFAQALKIQSRPLAIDTLPKNAVLVPPNGIKYFSGAFEAFPNEKAKLISTSFDEGMGILILRYSLNFVEPPGHDFGDPSYYVSCTVMSQLSKPIVESQEKANFFTRNNGEGLAVLLSGTHKKPDEFPSPIPLGKLVIEGDVLAYEIKYEWTDKTGGMEVEEKSRVFQVSTLRASSGRAVVVWKYCDADSSAKTKALSMTALRHLRVRVP